MPEGWQTGLLLIWGAYLLWSSVSPRPNFASWHMFAGITHTQFFLHDGAGRRFDCWRYIPHTKLGLSLPEAELLLIYVTRVHGIRDLCGTIVNRTDFVTVRHRVVDSELVK
jgi:hypothetical protein